MLLACYWDFPAVCIWDGRDDGIVWFRFVSWCQVHRMYVVACQFAGSCLAAEDEGFVAYYGETVICAA